MRYWCFPSSFKIISTTHIEDSFCLNIFDGCHLDSKDLHRNFNMHILLPWWCDIKFQLEIDKLKQEMFKEKFHYRRQIITEHVMNKVSLSGQREHQLLNSAVKEQQTVGLQFSSDWSLHHHHIVQRRQTLCSLTPE